MAKPTTSSIFDVSFELPTIDLPACFLPLIVLVKRSSDRCPKRKLTGAKKEADRSVDFPILHEMTVDPWVEPDADWAIVSPYFCPLVMGKDVPFWPANGVKYPVP
nr:hypothetical protein [Tanacetum cinerariifolium]